MKTIFHQDLARLADGADAALEVAGDGGTVLASCSLWWTAVPRERTGVVGHFKAEAEADAAAAQLLAAAETHLRASGCDSAIGPMDGNTWRRYRLVTESAGRAPFFLEPQNPTEWPGYFVAAGWRTLATYTSCEIDLSAEAEQPAIARLTRRLEAAGLTIRSLRPDDYSEELRKIYEVSVVSFQNNFLYTPISFEDFAAMYLKVEKLLVPEFSLIAEDGEGGPAGFVFALPEPTDPGGTIIVKTLAVLPERRFAGLGSLLVERVHRAAQGMGFARVIHALQHQSNSSLKISSRHAAKVFRGYSLFEKALT